MDYIRSNRAVPLAMADLERLSHFSARHLTTLFRERFNCTPMQFVRRQRLEMAMERLTAPQPGDTVPTPVVTINTLLASTRGGLDQSTTNRT